MWTSAWAIGGGGEPWIGRGTEQFISERVVHYTNDHLGLVRKRDGYGKMRKTVGKVGGSINRVDIPAIIARLPRNCRLFGNNLMSGELGAEQLGNECIRGFIDVGDEIDNIRLLDEGIANASARASKSQPLPPH